MTFDSDVSMESARVLCRSTSTLNTGSYTVSEAPGTLPAGTDLGDYQKQIDCLDKNGAPVAATTGDSAGPLNVSVGFGDDTTCTITNTREQGKLTVTKAIVGDPGNDTFNLKIGYDVVKENAVDGGSHTSTLNTGSYTVSEADRKSVV